MAGAAIWLPVGRLPGPAAISVAQAIAWHRQELLFGAEPAVCAGFLLTALPRWTGRPPASPAVVRMLLALWLAGRAAAFVSPPVAALVAALFILALALLAARNVIAAHDRRDVKIVVLLFAFSLGAALVAHPSTARHSADFGYKLSLAAVVGLIIVVGGRIVPSLTAAHLRRSGVMPASLRLAAIETVAAATTALALAAWLVIPDAGWTGGACALACCGQVARLMQWRGWTAVTRLSILAFHVAYGWIAAGFALAAVHGLCGTAYVQTTAVVHAWTVGAMGLMSLSVMASMIRRQTGQAFVASTPMTVAYVCGGVAGMARLAPELLPLTRPVWFGIAAGAWVLAFGLFLAAFRRSLLHRGDGVTP